MIGSPQSAATTPNPKRLRHQTFYVFLWAHPGMNEALIGYEDSVLALVNEHGGTVVRRARSDGLEDRPLEIKLFEWESESATDGYMSDPRRTAMAADRDRAIARTEMVAVQLISGRVGGHCRSHQSRRGISPGGGVVHMPGLPSPLSTRLTLSLDGQTTRRTGSARRGFRCIQPTSRAWIHPMNHEWHWRTSGTLKHIGRVHITYLT